MISHHILHVDGNNKQGMSLVLILTETTAAFYLSSLDVSWLPQVPSESGSCLAVLILSGDMKSRAK